MLLYFFEAKGTFSSFSRNLKVFFSCCNIADLRIFKKKFQEQEKSAKLIEPLNCHKIILYDIKKYSKEKITQLLREASNDHVHRISESSCNYMCITWDYEIPEGKITMLFIS